MILCQEILDQIVAHTVGGYPEESCGMLLGEKGQKSVSKFLPCKNIYNEMHAKFPDTYPRDAKTAYLIDPRLQEKIFDDAVAEGMEVKVIFHSHTDHDAYFSAEDKLVAAPWGEPMYPGVSYLVVSIWRGKLKEMALYEWSAKEQDFVGRRIER